MANTYITCKTCGATKRSKADELQARLLVGPEVCANMNCAGTTFDMVEGKRDTDRAIVIAMAGKILGASRYTIPGPVRYNILRDLPKPGESRFVEVTFPTRDIKAALERLRDGKPLPIDVHDREHFNDGSKYKGQHLPIRNVKEATTYYTEWGMLSSSRGWEKNLGSERLITGATGEIYYSSLHYQQDWWWVFSAHRGVWTKFKLRA